MRRGKVLTMIAILFIIITVVIELFAGNAAAGETVMPMRGNPPNGVVPVNFVTGLRPGGAGEETAHAPAEFLAAPEVEEPRGKDRKARPGSLLRWKDHCVRMPRLVAGQALPAACAGGFALAPLYTERREDGAEKLFALLLKEFISR